MDYTVRGVAKNQTRLSDFHFHFSLQRQHWETIGEDDKDRVDDDEVVMMVAVVIKVTIANTAIAIFLKVIIALLCARY